MLIQNMQTEEEWNEVVIHLTLSEAAELRDSLESLLTETKSGRHEHVSSEDYKKEITILISEEKITEETGGSSGVREAGRAKDS